MVAACTQHYRLFVRPCPLLCRALISDRYLTGLMTLINLLAGPCLLLTPQSFAAPLDFVSFRPCPGLGICMELGCAFFVRLVLFLPIP